jgi:hypothetical protein
MATPMETILAGSLEESPCWLEYSFLQPPQQPFLKSPSVAALLLTFFEFSALAFLFSFGMSSCFWNTMFDDIEHVNLEPYETVTSMLYATLKVPSTGDTTESMETDGKQHMLQSTSRTS